MLIRATWEHSINASLVGNTISGSSNMMTWHDCRQLLSDVGWMAELPGILHDLSLCLKDKTTAPSGGLPLQSEDTIR